MTSTRFRDTSSVTVLVGPEKTPFVAHKEFLCEVSDYFKAALTAQFAEAKKNEISLPEQSAEIFENFLDWLYTKSIDAETWKTLGVPVMLKWDEIHELYVFAKYVMCPALCNEILNAVWKITYPGAHFCLPTPDQIVNLYRGTTEECGLRKLIMALFLWRRGDTFRKEFKETVEYVSKFPIGFCYELLVRTSRQASGFGEKDPFVERNKKKCPFSDE